jgi:hypothetical protein
MCPLSRGFKMIALRFLVGLVVIAAALWVIVGE